MFKQHSVLYGNFVGQNLGYKTNVLHAYANKVNFIRGIQLHRRKVYEQRKRLKTKGYQRQGYSFVLAF